MSNTKKLIDKYLIETVKNKLPKGWDKKSVKKLASTIGKNPDEHGFFDACVVKMSKHLGADKVKGFCANVKDIDTGTTYWRGKDKKKIGKTNDRRHKSK